MNGLSPAPKALVCNYCGSCENGALVKRIDPGCPPQSVVCNEQACQQSSGSSVFGWICCICSIISCILIILGIMSLGRQGMAGSGSGGSLLAGFALGDILGSLTR